MDQAPSQKKFSFFSILGSIEKAACIVSLVFLVLIAASEVLARLFGTSIPSSNQLLIHILLFLGLFAGMFAAGKGEHLTIALFHYVKNEKTRQIFSVITGSFSVFICTLLAWSSFSFIKIGLEPRLIGFIPNLFFALAMPLAFIVMALRFGLQLPVKKHLFFALALILGTAFSFSAIAKLVWGFDMPEVLYNLADTYYLVLYQIKLPLIILCIALALMGAPIFTAIAGIALVIIQAAGGEAEVVNSSVFSAFTDTNIIVIPLFTLTGFFLSESRAGERLVHCFRSLFSWIPGGLIIATVIICAFFTSFTGASGVTILALG